MQVNVKDQIPPLRGHWKLEVYDGDVERRPLTQAQVLENRFIMDRQRKENQIWREVLGHDLHSVILPMHAGEIVSRPIETIEGDNLVTTAGKGLLLDRLYALGTPPTQVNSMGVGTVATAAAIGDVQLNLGGGGSSYLQAFDALPTRSGLVVTSICTYAVGVANFQWQELAEFNGVTNGTSIMLNRIAPIGPFTKSAAVSIVVTVTLTQS